MKIQINNELQVATTKIVKANDLQIFNAVFCNKANVREGNQNNLKM